MHWQEVFLDHLNNIHQHIQFTIQTERDNCLPVPDKHLSESWRITESEGLPKLHSCQPLTKHSSTTPPFQAAGCALHTHKQVLNPMWPPVFMMSCSSAWPPLRKTDTANDSSQGTVSSRQGCQWPSCRTNCISRQLAMHRKCVAPNTYWQVYQDQVKIGLSKPLSTATTPAKSTSAKWQACSCARK